MVWVLDTYALTTVANAKQHLNIPDANTDQNDILTRFINSATAKIEAYLDRKIKKREFTEFHDGRGNDRLLLRNWPADKPTQLWDDPSSLFTDTTYQRASTEYELELTGEGGIGVILMPGFRFRRGRRNIKVVYEAGYSSIPIWAEEAALWTVEFLYDMRSDRRVGITSKGKNNENTNFAGELPEFVRNLLEPYKRADWPLATVAVEAP